MPFDHLGRWFLPTAVAPTELHAPLAYGHSYDSLVPAFTMQTPGELLERHYDVKRSKADWTDPATLRRYFWIPFLDRPDKAERPTHISAVRVPVCGGGSVSRGTQVAVEFRDRDPEGPSTGAHLIDLCGRNSDPTRLQGADDVVLDRLRGSELELVIAWPGYQPERFMVRVGSTKGGGPMTRFELGKQITIAYGLFFKKVEEEGMLPSAPGFYNIALDQGQNWRSESLGVQFMQLRLVRFRNTSDGSWAADMEVVCLLDHVR